MDNIMPFLVALIATGIGALISWLFGHLHRGLIFLVPILLGLLAVFMLVSASTVTDGWAGLAYIIFGIYAIGIGITNLIASLIIFLVTKKQLR